MMGLLLLASAFALVLLALGLASVVVGAGPPGSDRLGTAARALPYGLLASAATLGLGRILALARGLGPEAVLGVTLSSPPTEAELTLALGRLGLALALPLFTAIVARSLSSAGRADRGALGAGSGPDRIAAWGAGLATAGTLVLMLGDPVALGVPLPLDALAALPLLGLTLTLWLASHPTEVAGLSPVLVTPAEQPPAPADPDPLQILLSAGLVAVEPDHLFSPRSRSAPEDPLASRLWEAAGGQGGPPEALGEALRQIALSSALVIPDVPGHTERALLTAILLGVLGPQAGRALILTPEPGALRDAVAQAMEMLGWWPVGPLVASPPELKAVGDAGRLPAAIFLTPEAANSEAVPWMGRGQGEEFARQLRCVVLSRPDLLDAVPSAHLYFTLARLRLRGRDGGRWAAVVTAHGTDEILRAVNTMLGTAAGRVPLRLPESGRVRLHRGLVRGGVSTRESLVRAVRDAYGKLVEAGVHCRVEDSAELLSSADLGQDRTRIQLDRPGTLAGDVTLMVVADEWIGPVFRVAPHRPPGPPAGQLLVWWVLPGPVANYLLEPGRLAAQQEEGVLPAPTPLFARENNHLRKLHLLAALHEGSPEEAFLRQAFGARRVTELLEREEARRVGRRAELVPATGEILRGAVLAPARGRQRPDTSRKTMTRAEVRVVDGTVGEVLDRVDQLTAATHYYPHRVFGARGLRYQVPAGGGFDAGSGTITVDPVGNGLEPTRPELQIELTLQGWLGERDTRSEDGLWVQAGDADVLVQERVERAMGQVGGSWSRLASPVQALYRSEIKVVWLGQHGPLTGRGADGLLHAARVLDDVLRAWLRCRDEHIEVVPSPLGWGGIPRPALLIVDRHVGGSGVAEALSLPSLCAMLRWVRSVMSSCPCDAGCPRCTPAEVLALAAKNEALALLQP